VVWVGCGGSIDLNDSKSIFSPSCAGECFYFVDDSYNWAPVHSIDRISEQIPRRQQRQVAGKRTVQGSERRISQVRELKLSIARQD
jgi:hypothetical protein